MTLPVHPLADLFPLIDGEEFDAFAEDMDSTASRLAGGRTPAPAEDDVVAASSSADQFFGEDERTIWKALSALDANITIEGPILDVLVRDRLIMTGAVDCGYLLTTRGLSTLGMYDAHFNPPDTGEVGCTAASAGGAVDNGPAPPELDSLDIPEFLKRGPDNSIPPRESEEAEHAVA